MTDVKLPELPEAKELWLPTHIQPYYDPAEMQEIMRSYGMACYEAGVRAGMERAAKIADERRKIAADIGSAHAERATQYIAMAIRAAIREFAGNGGERE